MSSGLKGAFFLRARFKLTLFYTAIQLVLVIGLCALLHYRNRRSMHKQLEMFLKHEAHAVLDFIRQSPDEESAISRHIRSLDRREHYYRILYRLINRKGRVVADSPRTWPEEVAVLRPEVRKAALAGDTHDEVVYIKDVTFPQKPPEPHLLMTFPSKDKETKEVVYVLQALIDLDRLERLNRHFLHNIYSAIPIIVLISWVSGYALARNFLRPLSNMARAARRITSTNLNERVPRSRSGDELDRLADTLNDMIARLGESFALLRQFAADAAHELRTPLTVMKGESEIALRSDGDDPAALRAALQGNIRECDHMIGVVANLLSLCQADTGDEVLTVEPLRLDLLLAELAETFGVLAEDAGLALEAGDFPECVVLGERSRLHQLFANLLDNAVKYTAEGGRVALACEIGEEEVRVTIADTGVGIPEDDQERIFERFYRVDHSRSRETGGSGIGLSIARGIAVGHGGKIELDSAPGAGSSFTVTLPLAEPARPGDRSHAT